MNLIHGVNWKVSYIIIPSIGPLIIQDVSSDKIYKVTLVYRFYELIMNAGLEVNVFRFLDHFSKPAALPGIWSGRIKV